eukprot:Opistho-1_new@28418
MLRNVRALLESNLAVLDVRSLAEHERRRISGSVCIPWTDINNRFCELPDKCVSFALLAPPEECAAIATRLRGVLLSQAHSKTATSCGRHLRASPPVTCSRIRPPAGAVCGGPRGSWKSQHLSCSAHSRTEALYRRHCSR